MYEYLKAHPDIFMPLPKEPHYFGSDLVGRRIPKTEAQYLKLFAKAREETRLGEASVWYLYSKRAAQEIYQFNPSSRIIIMLRNPIDMIYSLHAEFLYTANEDIADFELALHAEEDRRNGRRIPWLARFPQGLLYAEVARYSEQVRRYIDVFGREHLHIVMFDELERDTAGMYQETLKFLDVNPDFQLPHHPIYNSHKVARTRILRAIAQLMRITGRRLYRPLVPAPLDLGVCSAIMRVNTRYERRPSMDGKLRARLQERFAPEVSRLGDLLGRDLTHWVKDS